MTGIARPRLSPAGGGPAASAGSNGAVTLKMEEASVPPPASLLEEPLRLLARWLVAAVRGAAVEPGSGPPAEAQNPLDVDTGIDVMSNPE